MKPCEITKQFKKNIYSFGYLKNIKQRKQVSLAFPYTLIIKWLAIVKVNVIYQIHLHYLFEWWSSKCITPILHYTYFGSKRNVVINPGHCFGYNLNRLKNINKGVYQTQEKSIEHTFLHIQLI